MTLFAFLAAAPSLFAAEVWAQVIVAPGGRTLFSRQALVRSFLRIENTSLEADGTSVKATRHVPVLAVVYGVHPGWSIIGVQPYLSEDFTTRTANKVRDENFNGLGDTQVFVQYDRLYKRNTPGGLTRLSGLFGLQLPTGAERFSTNAVEYTGGLILEHAVGLKYVFLGDFQYTVATENDDGLDAGDHVQFDAAVARFVMPGDKNNPDASWPRRLFNALFPIGAYFTLEVNGTWRARASRNGRDLTNSGGTTLFISPGIQYFVNNRTLLEFSSPIPVVEALNGTQLEPDSTFLFGLRFLF